MTTKAELEEENLRLRAHVHSLEDDLLTEMDRASELSVEGVPKEAILEDVLRAAMGSFSNPTMPSLDKSSEIYSEGYLDAVFKKWIGNGVAVAMWNKLRKVL